MPRKRPRREPSTNGRPHSASGRGAAFEYQPSLSIFLSLLPADSCRWLRARFQSRYFRQNGSGFFFERIFHGVIIVLRNFSRLGFEIQVTQVFVNRFLTFPQISDASLLRACNNNLRHMKNVVKCCSRNREADQRNRNHRSVSLRAWSRKRSSSFPRAGSGAFAATGKGRFLQL